MHLLIYAVKYLYLGTLDMDLPCAQIIGRLMFLFMLIYKGQIFTRWDFTLLC